MIGGNENADKQTVATNTDFSDFVPDIKKSFFRICGHNIEAIKSYFYTKPQMPCIRSGFCGSYQVADAIDTSNNSFIMKLHPFVPR